AGNAQATVSFTAPASNGGSPITHYTVKVFKNGSEQPSLSTTGAATTIAVIGLENDVTYTFKVFATNSAGSGPDSDESNAVTPAAPVTPPVFSATVPDAPHGINAIAGNASAIISFRAPAFDGGTPVASYTVKVYKAGVLQDITARGGSSPITINGLANGARYTFRVYATNLIGNSPDSAESEVVVPTGARLVANGNEIVGVKIKVEKDLENSSYIYRGVDIAIFEDANGNGSFTLRNDLSRRILTSSTSFNISLGNPDSYDPSKIYKVVYRILYSSSASGPILTKSWETVKDGGQEIIFSKLEAGTTAIPANPAGNSAASSGTKPGAKPVANPGNPAKGSEASGIKVTAEPENIAASKTEKVDNRLVSTIMLDDKKIQQKIAEEKPNATFAIPFAEQTDSAVGRLNGQTVKAMEAKAAVLELVVQNAAYVVPAAQINIDRVSEKLGSKIELKDILVDIKISQSNEQTEKIVLSTAQKSKYEVVVKPVEFEISCTYGEKTVNVTAFNSYVERLIALPEGADPAKITTGIVLNKDGSFSHVPTIITVIDGRYYAKINSLTNSAYSVIYSPKSFKDCEGHWAKKAIDNMASRLVVSGVDNEKYEPSRDITRAEFSAIMARALGIMRVNAGKDNFADVNLGSWYYDAVSTAYEYGIIKGFGNGRFAPDEKITREQAMSMIARAMKLTGLKPDLKAEEAKALLEDFKDSTQSAEWAAASIAECIKAGVVSGKDGKRLSPKDNITRAEVAAIVERLLKKSNLID
ncbi:MAG: S-layer homology domain-containing protein, partial [Clostridia bacterium]|nr:S-layer homology domain-containing protein [Clostridia bacterium]